MHIYQFLAGIRIPWRVAATGDMTLCVLDDAGLRIVRIDMLKHGTMVAGDDGERLARAYNDLAVVAACPSVLHSLDVGETVGLDLPHPDAGISPMLWKMVRSSNRVRLVSSAGKPIADVSWKGSPSAMLLASLAVLEQSLPALLRLATGLGY